MASLGPPSSPSTAGSCGRRCSRPWTGCTTRRELEVRLAKTIGLLQALGSAAGVPASGSTLQAALRDTATDAGDRRGRPVAHPAVGGGVPPPHGELRAVGRQRRGHRRPVAGRPSVRRTGPEPCRLPDPRGYRLQPLIARRHYFQTGTLRYFETCYADRAGLQADLFRGVLSADPGGGRRARGLLPAA